MRHCHLLIAVGLSLTPGPLAAAARAQELPDPSLAAEIAEVPDSTVIARLSLAEGALHSVTNSVELVAALRDHLTVDLAMPLDEALQVDLRGFVGESDGSILHFSLNALRYQSSEPLVEFPLATAIRESHGESFDDDPWIEFDQDDRYANDVWKALAEALDVGLPQASDAFQSPAAGSPIGLRVKHVHLLPFSFTDEGGDDFHQCCEDIEGPLLQIKPDVRFQSAYTEHAARLGHERTVLAIELEPGPTDPAPAPPGDADSDVPPEGIDAVDSRAAGPGTATWTEVLSLTQSVLAACDGDAIRNRGTSEFALDGQQQEGHAVYQADETSVLLTLGTFDAELDRCIVLVSPGGAPAPGTYPVGVLSREAFSRAPGVDSRLFIAAAAVDVGATETMHMGPGAKLVVIHGGTVEIEALDPLLTGKIELDGWITPELETWLPEGDTSGQPVRLTGTFEAEKQTR